MAGVEQIRDRIVGDEVFGPLHRACRVLQVIVRMLEMLGELSRSATRSDLHFKRICLTAELRNRTVGGIRSKGRQSKGQKHGDQLRGLCNNPQHYNTYLNGVSIMYSAIEMQGFWFWVLFFFLCPCCIYKYLAGWESDHSGNHTILVFNFSLVDCGTIYDLSGKFSFR